MEKEPLLHPQLAKDCVLVGSFPLSVLLLMKDANYPWCILAPNRDNLSEIYQLSVSDQQQLMNESATLSKTMMRIFHGDKMNIAALGNVVPQLHLHHIVRYASDAAWPLPVWGKMPVRSYSSEALQERIKMLQDALDKSFEVPFSIAKDYW